MTGTDRSEAQRKREESRRRRRESQASESEQPQEDEGSALEDAEHTDLKQAAKVAAAGAAVGAAVGAALAARDGQDDDDGQNGEQETPEATVDESRHQAEEPQPEAAETVDTKPKAVGMEPEAEHAAEEMDPEAPPERPERPERPEHPEQQSPAHGASRDETIEVARRAREQLHALQGRDAESVTTLERTAQGWTVTLEVVELRRVPDSTDVLASYELLLDDDKNVIRFTRGRRYYRSQADRDGAA